MIVGAGILIFITTTSGVIHALQIVNSYADCTNSTDGVSTWQILSAENGKCQKVAESPFLFTKFDCQAKIMGLYVDSTCSGNPFQRAEIGPCFDVLSPWLRPAHVHSRRIACEEAKFPIIRHTISDINSESCSETDFVHIFFPLDQCFSSIDRAQNGGTIYQSINSTHIKQIDVQNCNNMVVKKITYMEVGKCLRLPYTEHDRRFDILSAEPYPVMTDSGEEVLGDNNLRKTPI
jgi:hypothetical protein